MFRSDAEDLRNEARQKIAKAEQLERTWGIHPPCHLCGRRNDCGH
jgi:hypothetical protein